MHLIIMNIVYNFQVTLLLNAGDALPQTLLLTRSFWQPNLCNQLNNVQNNSGESVLRV